MQRFFVLRSLMVACENIQLRILTTGLERISIHECSPRNWENLWVGKWYYGKEDKGCPAFQTPPHFKSGQQWFLLTK